MMLAILILLLFASPAWGAIQHVQTVKVNGGDVISVTTGAITTTTGNLLVMQCNSTNFGTASVSDSKSNTWSQNPSSPVEIWPVYGGGLRQWYSVLTTGGTNHTVTATLSSGTGYWSCFLSEFSGIDSTPFDKAAATGDQSGTSMTSGATATRSQADEVLIAIGGRNCGGTTTYTQGTGFTIPANGQDDQCPAAIEYQIVSSAGTDAATMTASETVFWAMLLGTYKASTAPTRRPGAAMVFQ